VSEFQAVPLYVSEGNFHRIAKWAVKSVLRLQSFAHESLVSPEEARDLCDRITGLLMGAVCRASRAQPGARSFPSSQIDDSRWTDPRGIPRSTTDVS
jgi:hypothetical protein